MRVVQIDVGALKTTTSPPPLPPPSSFPPIFSLEQFSHALPLILGSSQSASYHLLKDFADLTRREESRVRSALLSFDDDHDDRLTQLQFRRALQTLGLNLRERAQVRCHAHD